MYKYTYTNVSGSYSIRVVAPKEQCDLAGMACLNENYNELAVLKAHWAKRTGLVCDCLPSCTETEMFLIKDEKTG